MMDRVASGDFWGMLDQTQRDVVRARARVRRFRAGTVLMTEGDRARSVLVIVSGLAKVISSGPGGHEAVLNVCGPGDIVGEIAAVDGGPRSGAVIAVRSAWPCARATSMDSPCLSRRWPVGASRASARPT